MSTHSWAKNRIYQAAGLLGINAALRLSARRRLVVLCYHSVVESLVELDSYCARLTIDVQRFRQQLQLLKRCFTPVSGHDVVDALQGRHELPPNPVLVTFDDGYKNNLTCAALELERQSVPAIFFVTTSLIGTDRLLWTSEVDERILGWSNATVPMPGELAAMQTPRDHAGRARLAAQIARLCKRLPDQLRRTYLAELGRNSIAPPANHAAMYEFLNWDNVRELAARGFQIGSHTVDHPILGRLDASDVEQQLSLSKEKIEAETGIECQSVAYPNGGRSDCPLEVLQAAERCGYRAGYVLYERGNPRSINPLEIDRICLTANMGNGAFAAATSGLRGIWQPQDPSDDHSAQHQKQDAAV